MRHFLALPLLVLLLSACSRQQLPYTFEATSAAIPAERLARFEKEVTRAISRIEKEHDVTIGVSLTDDVIAYHFNGDRLFQAAETINIPLMITLYRLADAGTLDLGEELTVRTTFPSLIDGSPYRLAPGPFTGQRVGEGVALQSLAREMIQVGDNVAANLLLERVPPAHVTGAMRRLGATDGYVIGGVGDGVATGHDIANRQSPRDLTGLVHRIHTNQAASSIACAEMRQALGAQQDRAILPAGLPRGTMVHHMPGSLPGLRHDTGIVSTHVGNYYVTIMSEWPAGATASDAVLAELARKIYTEWTFLRE